MNRINLIICCCYCVILVGCVKYASDIDQNFLGVWAKWNTNPCAEQLTINDRGSSFYLETCGSSQNLEEGRAWINNSGQLRIGNFKVQVETYPFSMQDTTIFADTTNPDDRIWLMELEKQIYIRFD